MRSVLVVIPTLNEVATIEGVLKTLSVDLPAGIDVRFVVADGGSRDGTVEIVQKIASARRDVTLMRNELRIQSAGVNLALKCFGHTDDILVRCDAHNQYPSGYIAALLASLNRTGADSIVVSTDTVGETGFQKAVAWVTNTSLGSGGAWHRGGRKSGFVDHGHHGAMTIAIFQGAGQYDSSFSHNEDAEFDCRLRALGGRIFLDADIRVRYFPRKDPKSLWQQYFNYGRGRSRTIRRHPASVRLRQVAVPAHLCLIIASSLAAALVSPVFLAYPISVLLVLLTWAVIIAAKKKSLCGLLSAPAAFVMHTAWACGFFQGLLTIRETPWRQSKQAAIRSENQQKAALGVTLPTESALLHRQRV
jgi:succinoglycan biosynthesis protein ExoA